MSTGTGNAAEHVNAQFTLTNVWHRLGRLVFACLGLIVSLGRAPNNIVEWAGFGMTAAGAIWTGEVSGAARVVGAILVLGGAVTVFACR